MGLLSSLLRRESEEEMNVRRARQLRKRRLIEEKYRKKIEAMVKEHLE